MSRLGYFIWGIIFVVIGIWVIISILQTVLHVGWSFRGVSAKKVIFGVVLGLLGAVVLAVVGYLVFYNLPAIIKWLTEPV